MACEEIWEYLSFAGGLLWFVFVCGFLFICLFVFIFIGAKGKYTEAILQSIVGDIVGETVLHNHCF